nr:HAD-IIIA family hydrolase [Lachnospiraceae bacterium]
MMPRMEDVQVVVMMGGVGSRLGDIVASCPKPLLPVGKSLPSFDKADSSGLCKQDSIPFFEYELRLLIVAGFRRFLFCTGYMSSEIEDYFGGGEKFGVNIIYQKDAADTDGNAILLGTGGALRHAYEKLDEDFLLVYADSFMDIDYREVVYRYHEAKEEGALSLMTLLHNDGCFDRSNVVFDEGKLKLYDKDTPLPEMDHIDYGVNMFSRSVLDDYNIGEKFDLSVIQHKLSLEGRLAGLVVTRRFYEIGRPEPYREFISYAAGRFEHKKKAAFLDRDGVINEIVYNEDTELLDSPLAVEELKLIDGAADAIARLKAAGYLVFIITNQPAAAKGKTSLGTLFDINKRLKELIPGIDDVFMCPHHPKGSERSREKNLIGPCDCRKPGTGLIREAFEKYAIDPGASFMAGDSYTDILCARSAKLKAVFIGDYKCDICARL